MQMDRRTQAGDAPGTSADFEQFLLAGGCASQLADTRARYFMPPPPSALGLPPFAQQMLDVLVGSIAKVATMLIRAHTVEEHRRLLSTHWNEYTGTVDALHVVLALVLSVDRVAAIASLFETSVMADLIKAAEGARGVSDPAVVDEIRFARSTYLAAAQLGERISGMPSPRDPSMDHLLCCRFRAAACMHLLGLLCILGAPADPETTEIGVRGAFDLLRQGALCAYASVREALDLRVAPETIGEPLPFDDEDAALAGAP
ncbi:MAG: hypothetical protein HY744_03695 [Deltaproteobacteria bacterium]|nr:hypothetical protein [Deltaproteobacteria bacterium]